MPSDKDRHLHKRELKELENYRLLPADTRIVSDGSLGPYLACRSQYETLSNTDSVNLLKGDVILFSKRKATKFKPVLNFLSKQPGVLLVHKSSVLEVYTVIDDIRVPP